MGLELQNRLRVGKNRSTKLLKLGDELAERRKKQPRSASPRKQSSQTSRVRTTRAGNPQALAPLIDPANRIPLPSSPASHRPRQQNQPSMPPRLLELQVQQSANVRPGHQELYALPENGIDACPPPIPATMHMVPPFTPMDRSLTIDTVFLGGEGTRKVRGYVDESQEHSFVTPSLAVLGKRGIETGLPLQSHGAADMTQMTVIVPVRTPDGRDTIEMVGIWARVNDYFEGDHYFLGWRALNKISAVRNGHASTSKPVDVPSSSLTNGYVVPAGININSPPPSSVYSSVDQSTVRSSHGHMNPGATGNFPTSPLEDAFDHDMSSIGALTNNTGMHPDATSGAQTTRWANSTLTNVFATQTITAQTPMVSGSEVAGTDDHQGFPPSLVSQDGHIRWNENLAWWSPSS